MPSSFLAWEGGVGGDYLDFEVKENMEEMILILI
jgi:hypothetical protein